MSTSWSSLNPRCFPMPIHFPYMSDIIPYPNKKHMLLHVFFHGSASCNSCMSSSAKPGNCGGCKGEVMPTSKSSRTEFSVWWKIMMLAFHSDGFFNWNAFPFCEISWFSSQLAMENQFCSYIGAHHWDCQTSLGWLVVSTCFYLPTPLKKTYDLWVRIITGAQQKCSS